MRLAHKTPIACLLALCAGGLLALGAGHQAAAQAPADPIGLARAGWLECEAPNAAAHTCHGISRYVFNRDGSVDVFAEQVISPSQHINAQIHQRIAVRDGAFCGSMDDTVIDGATVTVNGSAAPAGLAEQARAFLRQNAAHGKQCESYQARADGLMLHISIDNADQPQFDRPVSFVRPTDGYRVDGP